MDFAEKVRMLHYNIGWSHRQLAKHLGVSIRQIQKAIDPEKRRRQDRERGPRLCGWERARRAG